MTIKQYRFELYKACKWEVENFHEDCGFSLVDMWDIVNDRADFDGHWWRLTVLDDYKNRRTV